MLCSPSAVKEVLDKQSAFTSSRAPMPVASDALSGGMRFLFMEYGALWRRLRGVSHRLLTPAASDAFRPSQEWEGRALCAEVLGACAEGEKGTEKGYEAVRRYTVSVIMTSTYGRRVPEWVGGCLSFSFDLGSIENVIPLNAQNSFLNYGYCSKVG
jgi:cytochrome P450